MDLDGTGDTVGLEPTAEPTIDIVKYFDSIPHSNHTGGARRPAAGGIGASVLSRTAQSIRNWIGQT
jgi:hypothetical protein